MYMNLIFNGNSSRQYKDGRIAPGRKNDLCGSESAT